MSDACMSLNINKCVALTCSCRLLLPFLPSNSLYTIDDHTLTCITQHPYSYLVLAMLILLCLYHPVLTISYIKLWEHLAKFVKRNLHKCNSETKCMAYAGLFRPAWNIHHLWCIFQSWSKKNAWDLYLNINILFIKMVQRQARVK